ncbi:MAG: septum formation initiator family protein [Longimicrobiales bacterium]|nr:septum formation initiator family protein [Longimicrobiales bacterium]
MGRLKRYTLPAILAMAAYSAVFGGEHTHLDLVEAHRAIEEESRALAELHLVVDSLEARADSLENDPVTLERVARERYGMIREGEILYRFAEPVDEEGREEAGTGRDE